MIIVLACVILIIATVAYIFLTNESNVVEKPEVNLPANTVVDDKTNEPPDIQKRVR